MFRCSVSRAALVLAVAFAAMAFVANANAESSALSRDEMGQMVGAQACYNYSSVSGCADAACHWTGSMWHTHVDLSWEQLVSNAPNGRLGFNRNGDQQVCRYDWYDAAGCNNQDFVFSTFDTQPWYDIGGGCCPGGCP